MLLIRYSPSVCFMCPGRSISLGLDTDLSYKADMSWSGLFGFSCLAGRFCYQFGDAWGKQFSPSLFTFLFQIKITWDVIN